MADDRDLLELTPEMQQDPLPEHDWFWRRTFTFLMSIVSLGFIWYGIEALWDMRSADGIYRLTRYMIGILFVLILFYMVAPSAEQIVKLVQAAKLLRARVPVVETTTTTKTAAGATQTREVAAGAPEPPKLPSTSERPVAGDADDVAPRSRT